MVCFVCRFGRFMTPSDWTRSSYANMLVRGAVPLNLPPLTPE
jgi:hypothetical protein